jgi:DNA-binding CsgD family transcriptional regulator
VEEVASALNAAPRSDPPDAVELLITAQAVLVTEGYATGMPVLKRALAAFGRGQFSQEEELRGLPFACVAAHSLRDDKAWLALSARYVQIARDAGALTVLPVALEFQGALRAYTGEFSTAWAVLQEASALATATGSPPVSDALLLLAAWSEKPEPALERIRLELAEAAGRGEESTISFAEYAAAVVYNGLGRYELGLAAAQRSNEHHARKAGGSAQVEVVEAAARTGEHELAVAAFGYLCETTRPSDTDWARGIEARAGALIAEADEAEALYRQAVELLGRTSARTDLARAHLLYGEWLRREGRRLDAREQLRAAHELLLTMGAEAFTERTARELAAAGEKARKRTRETRDELTAQETQIARLAAEGSTNPEIGAQLFISARTVEWHLRKVYAKLGITRRSELRQALPNVGWEEPRSSSQFR